MDLKKEIKEMSKNNNAQKILKDLRTQQFQLQEKIFILQVIEIAKQAERLFDKKEFQRIDVKTIHLSWHHEAGIGNRFNFNFLKSNGDRFIGMSDGLSNFAGQFVSLSGFYTHFINEKFTKNENIIFNTDNKLKENLLDLLLETELKKIVSYNMLQIELDNNEASNKKLKI